MSDESNFLEALPVIDDVAAQVCRRHRLSASEADDFKSEVRLHFIERNYEVLRKFEGRCALSTYINVVSQRLYLDYRNRMWGRWRPSTEARRLGATAIKIEQLVARDGWTIDQAIEMLRTNHRAELDETTLTFCNSIAARGPARRVVSEDDAAEVASQGPSADDNVVKAERDFLVKRILAALERALQGLPPQGRLILKMKYYDRVTVSNIARALNLEQRPLYRTVEDLERTVGEAMKADGISEEDLRAMFNTPAIEWNDQGPDGPLSSGNATGSDEKGASWRRSR